MRIYYIICNKNSFRTFSLRYISPAILERCPLLSVIWCSISDGKNKCKKKEIYLSSFVSLPHFAYSINNRLFKEKRKKRMVYSNFLNIRYLIYVINQNKHAINSKSECLIIFILYLFFLFNFLSQLVLFLSLCLGKNDDTPLSNVSLYRFMAGQTF